MVFVVERKPGDKEFFLFFGGGGLVDFDYLKKKGSRYSPIFAIDQGRSNGKKGTKKKKSEFGPGVTE